MAAELAPQLVFSVLNPEQQAYLLRALRIPPSHPSLEDTSRGVWRRCKHACKRLEESGALYAVVVAATLLHLVLLELSLPSVGGGGNPAAAALYAALRVPLAAAAS